MMYTEAGYVLTVNGRNVYDPRVKENILSNNPALIMADLMIRREIITSATSRPDFWDEIAKLADYCDKVDK